MKSSYRIYNDQPVANKKRSPLTDEKLDWWWAILLIASIGLIFGLTLIAFYKLPQPINEDTASNFNNFISSRAKNDLQKLIDIGPKVVGSAANEQVTVKFLVDTIESIIAESSDLYTIEYNIQEASGGYLLDRSTANLYQSIQNVVVKITPRSLVCCSSLLINTHFDTVPVSPGAGDAGTMVAVMLELLRSLTKSKDVLQNSVVFLFNGAEENGLQGSHAFITQHKWAKNITAFINLDAAGNGGKEMLFQTGPDNPWLIDYYQKSAKHPYGSSIGEEVFENELIPSDTDFRNFRDFGNIPGLDLADTYNDFVYHTQYDRIEIISDGTYQHIGDNILSLVRALANAPELDIRSGTERSHGKAVFFDIFGVFMINYSETTGIVVNNIVAVAALITIGLSMRFMQRTVAVSFRDIIKRLANSVFIHLASIAIGAGVVLFLAIIIDQANYSLSWFSQPWLIFGLYFCPFIFVIGIFQSSYLVGKKFNSLPLRFCITLFLHAHCLILVILIFILTAFSIRSTFLITSSVLHYTVSIICILITKLYLRSYIWILPILIGQAIPFAFLAYISEVSYSIFIPISGRNGTERNPEILIAVCSIGFALLMTGFIIPIFSIFRKAKTILASLIVVMFVSIILIFTSVGFPYTPETAPQRHSVFHTKRIMHDYDGAIRREDSGYYLIALDRLSTSTLKDITNENGYKLLAANENCSSELLCGLPHYSPRNSRITMNSGYWIEAKPPFLVKTPELRFLSKTEISKKAYRYSFEMTGTKQTEIFIKPISGAYLSQWSFTSRNAEELQLSTEIDQEYFVHLRFGLKTLPYRFWLDINAVSNNTASLSIALVGHYLEQVDNHTDEFKIFLNLFPPWTCVSAFESTYESWYF